MHHDTSIAREQLEERLPKRKIHCIQRKAEASKSTPDMALHKVINGRGGTPPETGLGSFCGEDRVRRTYSM